MIAKQYSVPILLVLNRDSDTSKATAKAMWVRMAVRVMGA